MTVDLTNEQAEELGKKLREEDEAEKLEVQRRQRLDAGKQGEKRIRSPETDANQNAERDEDIRLRSAIGPVCDPCRQKLNFGDDGDVASSANAAPPPPESPKLHPDLEMHAGLTPPSSPEPAMMDALDTLDEIDVKMMCSMMRGWTSAKCTRLRE